MLDLCLKTPTDAMQILFRRSSISSVSFSQEKYISSSSSYKVWVASFTDGLARLALMRIESSESQGREGACAIKVAFFSLRKLATEVDNS